MHVYSNFNSKVKNALTDYALLFDRATRTNGLIDKDKTLAGWHQKAIVTREALQMVREKRDADIAEIKKTYQTEAANARIAPLLEEYSAVVSTAKQRAIDALQPVIDAKRRTLEKAADAPSEETVRLLSVVRMLDSLSAAEITDAAGKVGGNIHALKVLSDLAKRNGLYFPDIDLAKMQSDIDKAEQFALESIESMDVPTNEMGYKQRLFWMAPGTGEAKYFFDALDNQTFTAATIEDAGQSKAESKAAENPLKTPAKSGYNAVKITLRGDETAAGIAMQFGISTSDIRRANPDKDLASLRYMDTLVIPATRFHVSNAPGAIVEGQCLLCHYEPETMQPTEGELVDLNS